MRRTLKLLVTLGIIAVLAGTPALAGVGTQEQPVDGKSLRASKAAPQTEGVGGAFQRAWTAFSEFARTVIGLERAPKLPVIKAPVGKGVGTQE